MRKKDKKMTEYMLNFKEIEISDKPWMDNILHNENNLGCEYCFGNLFIWKDYFKSVVSKADENIFIFSNKGKGYLYPTGKGDLEKAVLNLKSHAETNGRVFKMNGVDEEKKALLEKIFPGKFTYTPYESGFDYIYNSSDLAELAGKKYHAKRNHIARFLEKYDYTFEEITPQNLPDCIALYESWYEENIVKNEHLYHERDAARLVFDNFLSLKMKGALIKINGKIIAFTIGEHVDARVFAVHIEKADHNIQGAYPLINQLFSQTLTNYEYINREEDMGVEGLRRAKLNYHPAIILKKYEALWI